MRYAIYTAMGGASQTLERQSITSHNLANSSTPGFRAQLAALRAVPVNGPSIMTRTLVTASTPGVDTTQGALNHTGRMLDVALHEEGFLAISLPDGSEAYSRNGSIQVSPEGQLTIQGMPLLGVSGPISLPPQAEITLASDGTLSALNPGDPPNTISQVGSIKLVKAKPSEMVRGDDGLFHLTPAAQQQRGKQLPNDPSMRVTPGMLESSNVKPVETMVDLINNARRFEMQMKVIHSVDENEQRANSLLSMS